MRWQDIIPAIIIILLPLAGFTVAIIFYDEIGDMGRYYDFNPFNKGYSSFSEEEIIENCKDLDLEKTSKCLRDNVKPLFNYVIRSDEIRSLDEIIENGGDCFDYSMLYYRMAKELGFSVDTLTTGGIRGVIAGHRLTILWDEDNYCKIDQLSVKCDERKK